MVLASTGCATVQHGVSQQIHVTSEPAGATITIESKVVGVTPAEIRLRRGDAGVIIHLDKDGFQPLDIPMKRKVSGWVAADAVALNPLSCQGLDSASACPGLILANAAIFFGLDFLTGAAFTYPSTVNGVLVRRWPSTPAGPQAQIRAAFRQ